MPTMYYVAEQTEKNLKYTVNKISSLFLFVLEQEIIFISMQVSRP